MRLCLMIFATLSVACCATAPQVQPRLIVPHVPADLRTPVKVAEREVATLGDVGVVLADHVAALDTANGKIVATDKILTKAEACAAAQPPDPKCAGPA